jgi:crotonobetainyl-CoA:carnitine CoA-transferase CaiB-like acyl-CoA transferase
MSITGDTDADGGQPTKVGVAISDVVSGLFGTVSVLAGLLARARDAAGGQRIDVSLLESTLAVLVNQAQNAFVGGRAPGRLGNAHPNLVPYETFRTADGELAVAIGSERQWPRLCKAIGLPGLADDPRYATNGDRVEHRAELRPILAARFAAHTTAEWTALLDATDIPNGPIHDIVAAFATPQAVARGMTVELEHPVLGAVRQVGIPFRLSATPATIRTAPPLLGEHTDQILAELGYAQADVRTLHDLGVV